MNGTLNPFLPQLNPQSMTLGGRLARFFGIAPHLLLSSVGVVAAGPEAK